MLQFDVSEICNWADLNTAEGQLPELVSRLILATTPQLSHLDMPSGSAVWMPGWDGLITSGTETPWVPKGTSAWELSRRKDIGTKANDDYNKRTNPPQDIDISTSTFVFVSPRLWSRKENWATQRCTEGNWANVLGHDANNLVYWLAQAPAVAEWFARVINKLPSDGYTTLDEWWENWATATQPNISPSLVLSGRQKCVDRLAEWSQTSASPYYVKAQTREEAIAFVAASALDSDAAWGATLLAKAVVVKSEGAWNSLVRHKTPLVLIRAFDGNVSSQAATSRGHHVITPLHANEEPGGNGIRLPRLGRDETVTALVEMDLSEVKARSMIRRTARNLPIIRRYLIDEAGGPTPKWATVDPQSRRPSLMLVGQWDETNENDKDAVAKITGRPYEEVVHEAAALAHYEDGPLTKIGSRWRFFSHEEAWHLLAPRLTAADVERFEAQAVQILGTESTAYELPVRERHLASIRGRGVPHSDLLRQGITRTLALMGIHGERALYVENLQHLPGQVLQRVLGNDTSWQIWATLEQDLATLAEAAPETVLRAIERCLSATPSPFEALFDQEGDPPWAVPAHTGLLHALERLAWSPDYFPRATTALARLSIIDPSSHTNGTPAGSLAELFLPWFRFSETTDKDRLATLKGLFNRVPEPAWKTLINLYPSSPFDSVVERQPPPWRPWGQDGAARPTHEECRTFVAELERLLLEHAGDDVERWKDIVGIIADLSPDTGQEALTELTQRAGELRPLPNSFDLWTTLRMELNRHRSYPDAPWAMPTHYLNSLQAAYQDLTPDDPGTAYAWLFDGYPYLPDGNPEEEMQNNEKIATARQSAITAAYDREGAEAILSIAEYAELPALVGDVFATSVEAETAVSLAVEQIDAENQRFRLLALGITGGLFRQSGWPVLERIIDQIQS